MKTVLVTDGENRSSLAATRSLGKKGYRVVVTGKKLRNISSCSKYCAVRFVVPDPLCDVQNYVKEITRIAIRENVDYLIPMTDHSVALLNRSRAGLPENIILACPNEEKVNFISNKSNLFNVAEKLNIPIPKTIHLNGYEDLKLYEKTITNYPVVIKPSFSKRLIKDRFVSGGVMYAYSFDELIKLYNTQPSLKFSSMIQEKIYGSGTGLFTLFDKDRHLALFSHRRIWEKPPSGGVSVVSKSVPLDKKMIEDSKRLLSEIGWEGVAMIEYKRDNRDGMAKLIEINGRFWGSLHLAISSGIDFPALFLAYLNGYEFKKVITNYRIGHRLKWFLGTLDLFLIRLKNPNSALNLPKDAPSKLQTLLEFLNIFDKNVSFNVISKNDLKPFLIEIKEYILNLY
jgi:predicted ATP-grasp superfamily ATP-dependent carboligase